MNVYRVMFVCLGNICRSPLAHTVFENLVRREGLEERIAVESSGTGAAHQGEPADSRMRKTAQRHGLTITHKSRPFQSGDLRDYDLILPMDNQNKRDILRLSGDPLHQEKVKLFRDYDPEGQGEVPDPWYGGSQGFEEVWSMVDRTAQVLLTRIRQDQNL